MAELKNEFSWSWSRHGAFTTCLRRYWLQHYAFWGGWDPGCDAAVREIYIQKRLNTRPQWMGTVIHRAAEWTLGEVRQGRFPPRERVVERFRREALRELDDSARGMYRVNPKRFPGLSEHYHGAPGEPGSWEQAVDEICRQVDGLFDNAVFLRLASVPERIREVEQLAQVVLRGVPVWVSLDALVEDGRGGFVVVDWKTGEAHAADAVSAQLGIYAAYVLSRYLGVDPDHPSAGPLGRVRTMYVSLREGRHEVFEVTPESWEVAIATVSSSASAMRALLRDPLENVAREVDFPMLPEGDPACGRCPFRRTCGR